MYISAIFGHSNHKYRHSLSENAPQSMAGMSCTRNGNTTLEKSRTLCRKRWKPYMYTLLCDVGLWLWSHQIECIKLTVYFSDTSTLVLLKSNIECSFVCIYSFTHTWSTVRCCQIAAHILFHTCVRYRAEKSQIEIDRRTKNNHEMYEIALPNIVGTINVW